MTETVHRSRATVPDLVDEAIPRMKEDAAVRRFSSAS